MVQNIKTDVVYYKTNTDFEMEFNLCGCCLMRLLTDKALDKKTLIADLSRAVARSRVILVVGALFGEDNIINNISCAIGKNVVYADNETYGINSSEQIEIIEGATPLVTTDGIFGGCIIESGPQTMILLSESRNIRKSIMNSLIHPYIKEIYAAELSDKAAANNDMDENLEEELLPEDEKAAAEEIFEENTEEIQEGTEETDDSGIVIPEEEAEEFWEEPEFLEEEDLGLYAEPQKVLRKEAKFYNEAYSDFELDDVGLVGSRAGDYDEFGEYNEYNDYEDGAYYVTPPFTKIATIVISILILITLAVLAFFIFYLPSKDGISATEYIKDIYNTLFG